MRLTVAAIMLLLCVGPQATAAADATQSRVAPPGARSIPAATAARIDYGHLRYRSIGPAIAGGRVAAVAGSDRNPFLYYVGAAGGGVFKTENGGVSFSDVFGKEPVGAIGAIAISPHNDNDVWVGTGEANPRNDVSYGDGVWRSMNGGKTWQHRGLADSALIAKILVDPRNPNIALVAALGDPWKGGPQRGVFRTSDGGKTWTKTLYLGPSSGAADLAWNPRDPDTIYAGMWEFRRSPWMLSSGGPAGGLYRSRDNGRSWTKLTRGLPAGITGRIGIAVAPSLARRVYAVIQSRAGVIWRSDDGGDSWRLTDRDTLPGQRPFYFSHLRVDPKNAKRVISLSMYLTQSTDGGTTFKHLTRILHPDNHDLWWSADGKRIIEGNDGGFIISNDAGSTWSAPSNIVLAQTYHVGYDLRSPYNVCTGLQDNSSWCGPSNSRNGIGVLNRDWTSIAGGDGVWAWPDPADPSLVWTDTQDGVLTIYDSTSHQVVDVSPYPRDAFTSLAGIAQNAYRFNWNSPLAFSPFNPHVAYFGGNVVFRTADRGRHWTPISPDLTRDEKDHQRVSGGPISLDVSGAEYYDTSLDIAPSPLDAGVMWVGTDDGLVQLTRDGGAHWTNVRSATWPKYGRVEVVEPGHFAAGTAIVNIDRHDLGDRAPYLFRTDDFGATWRSIVANLPADTPVRTVRQDPKNPDVLYAGTETGVWVSLDRGVRWSPLQLNLPTSPVFDLRIQPIADDLIVATHGRGIFILDDLAPIQALAAARRTGIAFFPVRTATLFAQWPPIETGDGGTLPNNFFVGPNPPAGALLTFYARTPARTRASIDIVAADGHIVRHLAGTYDTDEGRKYVVPNDAGINRLAWNGLEDAPVKWRGTTRPNRGPADGPEALPGRYVARLHVAGRVLTAPFELAADPASPWTLTQLGERHAFLARLFAQYSQVDSMLNRIDDDMRALRGAKGSVAQVKRERLERIRATLTSDARNDEDGIGRPDRLRERIGGLIGALSSSFQPPFAAHLAAAAQLTTVFDETLAQARGVLDGVAVR
jgi:photosystem II stability/assembly factor-like uncharacterized protein